MKVLLSCVNSAISLAGFDWEQGDLFWSLPTEKLRTCGIAYSDGRLIIGSDDRLHIVGHSAMRTIKLPGPHSPLLHSVGPLSRNRLAAMDTGHSCLRIYDYHGSPLEVLSPLAGWNSIPPDAIHLNAFVETPYGILASCFDYRPWRAARQRKSWESWCHGGYGLVLNLDGGQDGHSGRIVACGLNHPHSLLWHDEHLFICSSATGVLHRLKPTEDGCFIEVGRMKITETHFLRGMCVFENQLVLGGSTARHGQALCQEMAVYCLSRQTGELRHKLIPVPGEIYDIVPWHDDVLELLRSTHLA